MALKKSKPRKILPAPDLNITSLMDVLTTLIFFIVMMASFNNLMTIPATPLHSGKPADSSENRPTFTLKIAVLSDTVIKMFVGPTQELDVINRAQFDKYMRSQFTGTPQTGYNRVISTKDKSALFPKLQGVLSKIKESFPSETKAVVAFGDQVSYQTTVDALAGVRSLAPGQTAVPVKAIPGKADLTRVLFPEVIISEWSEEK